MIDLSAWARGSDPSIASRWEELVDDGRLLCHPVFAIERLHSAVSSADYAQKRRNLEDAYEWMHPDGKTADLALKMQARMAGRAACIHRVKTPDLLIAALAVQGGVGVLHYDRDYDLISEHAGEPFESQWIAERGSLEPAEAAAVSKRKAYRKAFGQRMIQLRDGEDLTVWPELIRSLDERLAERGLGLG